MKDFADFIEAALVFLILCFAFGIVSVCFAAASVWDKLAAKLKDVSKNERHN